MASVPYEYACNNQAGFSLDPNAHPRLGYLTSLGGLGLTAPLARDLTVSVPFSTSAPPAFAGLQYLPGASQGTAKVAGVIEKFSWAGGVGDPINLIFYVSQMNAVQLKSLQQMTLKTTSINSLGWWIADYDQEAKKWFEEAYPQSGLLTGALQGKTTPALNVDLTPVVAKTGINVYLYKVTLAVSPAANRTYTLQFANSSAKKVIKSWGLMVGTLAGGGLS